VAGAGFALATVLLSRAMFPDHARARWTAQILSLFFLEDGHEDKTIE
jgi:hypothetical protein